MPTVTTRDSNISAKGRNIRLRHVRWWILAIAGVLIAVSAGISFKMVNATPVLAEPPEQAKVLKAQDSMGNFGILIPAYLPKGFDRAKMEVNVNQSGPAGEPAVDMVYRGKNDSSVFLHQWVPANPELETLNGSRVIETKWGKSWLLTEGTDGLVAVWADVGPLRLSISSPSQSMISREQLVMAAESVGLASNLQVYSFASELPQIKDMIPPPPVEIKTNGQGVQEFNLTITPGGYTPMRFAVQRDVPVKINFRALGEVGCGNTLIFPIEGGNFSSLALSKEKPLQVLEFTPSTAGDFAFRCTSNCYRGVMTVRP